MWDPVRGTDRGGVGEVRRNEIVRDDDFFVLIGEPIKTESALGYTPWGCRIFSVVLGRGVNRGGVGEVRRNEIVCDDARSVGLSRPPHGVACEHAHVVDAPFPQNFPLPRAEPS